jgi:cytochrome b subunit of formate dehydrogenase
MKFFNFGIHQLLVILILTSFLFVPLFNALSQTNDECLACHGDKSTTMEKSGKSISLFVDQNIFGKTVHNGLSCIDCHSGFNAGEIPHAKKITAVKCLTCHDGTNVESYTKSVHANVKGGARCKDCHGTHNIVSQKAMQTTEWMKNEVQVCGSCHPQIVNHYLNSSHGNALTSGVKGAPFCSDCHGEHTIKAITNKESLVSRQNEEVICLKCHLDNPDVRKLVSPSAAFIKGYDLSVHGKAMKAGKTDAATCSDCHGSHEMQKGSDPNSFVSKTRIAETCGKCHSEIENTYKESEHGKALAKGVISSATCTDCHGEHTILSPGDPKSATAASNISGKVCTPCHSSVKLTQKYGMPGQRYESFADSYHGLAAKGGDVEVANCASCHGFHDIKSSIDPKSKTNKANLVATCGSCHPGANLNFTKGNVHLTTKQEDNPVLYFISTGYVILIVLIISGMLLHNILDFVKKSKTQLMKRRGLIPHHQVSHRLYLRMTLFERIQHASLLISFFTLVVTGFMLKFPDAWWVAPIRNLSPVVFEVRSLLHRTAAIVMIVASLVHLYYIIFIPRGRQLIKDLLPVRKDITDAIGILFFNLGLNTKKPMLDRFSYIEKSEYWALIWGNIVMIATGFILWFDNTFMGLLTKLGWDIARTIHYYEAWLATLAIIVWHIYFVIFNPDIYPMNLAWLKGSLTETEMEEEHPLELEKMKREQNTVSNEEIKSPVENNVKV